MRKRTSFPLVFLSGFTVGTAIAKTTELLSITLRNATMDNTGETTHSFFRGEAVNTVVSQQEGSVLQIPSEMCGG